MTHGTKSEVCFISFITTLLFWGSGFRLSGRAVASDTKGPWFDSSHLHKFIYIEHFCLLPTVY